MGIFQYSNFWKFVDIYILIYIYIYTQEDKFYFLKNSIPSLNGYVCRCKLKQNENYLIWCTYYTSVLFHIRIHMHTPVHMMYEMIFVNSFLIFEKSYLLPNALNGWPTIPQILNSNLNFISFAWNAFGRLPI